MPGPGRPSADAASSGGAFEGFDAADFAAYEPKKWTSNAFTLPRRRAKDKVIALAKAVVSELREELGDLELHASDEAPTVANGKKVEAQWAFLMRDGGARQALKSLTQKTDLSAGAKLFDISLNHQHASIALKLDGKGFTVGVEIAGKARADRDNAVAKLREVWAREKLAELCRELPGGTTIGIFDKRFDALTVTPAEIETWIPLLAGESMFSSESFVSKEDVAGASAGLIGTVVQHVGAHLPIYRFLAWARDNEAKPVKKTIEKVATEQAKKRQPAFAPGDRVTILAGLFAGRSGYLAEVDQKGRAKVMVGPVSVSVEAKDLKAG